MGGIVLVPHRLHDALHGASREEAQVEIPLCVPQQGESGVGQRLPLEKRPVSQSGRGAVLADLGQLQAYVQKGAALRANHYHFHDISSAPHSS